MEWIFKLVGRFFPNIFRETKEQESFVKWTLLLSRAYPGLAVAMCFGCFMPIDIRNEIPTPKQQSQNKEALKSAQHILDKEVKILSPATTLQAIKNEIRQLIENSQTEKVVPHESRTSFETNNKTKTPGRDKFSETTPKIFAPPESINMAYLSLFRQAILPIKTGKQMS
jgi:hypothetical protein